MKDERPIIDYDDPARPIDSDEAWARLAQPTGRRRLSWFLLLRVVALACLLIALFFIGRLIWLGIRT